MANAKQKYKNALWVAGGLGMTEQGAGICPVPAGMAGYWNDAGVVKLRLANGSDQIIAGTGGVQIIRVHAVATSALAANTYANGTAGVGATLTGNANGAFATIDGVAPVANNVYLVTAESASENNGPYILTQLGTAGTPYILTRIEEFDESAEMRDGTIFEVRGGTVNANTFWKFTGADSPTVGTTSLVFARDPLTVTTNTAQTITGPKDFAAGALKCDNNSTTNAHTFVSAATAARNVTLPDATFTVPQDALVVHLAGAETITGVKTFASGADPAFAKEANHSVAVVATTTAATVGGNLAIAAGAGNTTGAGGAASLTGGAGGNDAVGGAASLVGGAAGGGNRAGGAAAVTGGAGAGTQAGGAVAATGGVGGATGAGGAVTVTGGAGGATSGVGGAVSLTGGAATANNDNGGAVTIAGGAPHGTGAKGIINLNGRLAAGATDYVIPDPGNGGAIAVTTSGVCNLTSAGAETRTLAIPTFVGQEIALSCDVDGGDNVITVASAFNQAGNTAITLNDAGDFVLLKGVHIAGALRWRLVVNDGATLGP